MVNIIDLFPAQSSVGTCTLHARTTAVGDGTWIRLDGWAIDSHKALTAHPFCQPLQHCHWSAKAVDVNASRARAQCAIANRSFDVVPW
jgi:hypothetical protein